MSRPRRRRPASPRCCTKRRGLGPHPARAPLRRRRRTTGSRRCRPNRAAWFRGKAGSDTLARHHDQRIEAFDLAEGKHRKNSYNVLEIITRHLCTSTLAHLPSRRQLRPRACGPLSRSIFVNFFLPRRMPLGAIDRLHSEPEEECLDLKYSAKKSQVFQASFTIGTTNLCVRWHDSSVNR